MDGVGKGDNLLVEYRNTAEWTASPLSEILFKIWVEGLDEGPHERNFEPGTSY